jgi:hypothetical protein
MNNLNIPPSRPILQGMPELVCDRAEIARTIRLLFKADDVIEVRIPKTRAGTVAGYFDDHSLVVDAIVRADRKYRPSGVYFVLNPLHPALLARSYIELSTCPFNADHTGGSAALIVTNGVPGFTCKHNSCRGKTINDLFAKYPAESPANCRVNRLPNTSGIVVADGWPKVESIQSELPPVKPFSEDLLPDSLRPMVLDVGERLQVPIDFPAAAAVLCLAGSVNRRAAIQPKAQDTGWIVIPNLWGGIVAPPGYLKSPVLQLVTHSLNEIQTRWHQAHEAARQDYERSKEEYELRRAAWKEQYKAASKGRRAAPDRPENEPEVPKLRRLIVNDATFEALHQTMRENPAGILLIRDELTGWLSQLDRPGREGERAFCLQAWNGDTVHTIDRIGRGTTHVPHCCMSMLGGIQPGRLRSYLAEALEDGPSNDGLIQRFQVLVSKKKSRDREKSVLEVIREELGNRFVREVDGAAIQCWYHNLTARGLSQGTAVRHFNVMHHMMGKAATIWSKETGIERNPADQVEVVRPNDQRERYLEAEEIQALKLALDQKMQRKGDRGANQTFLRLRLIVLIALTTGMRIAEVFYLRRSDLLFREELIAVRAKLKGGTMR